MSSSKVNILFPIETINRELDFRLYLAALCVDSNARIFIGSDDAILSLFDHMRGGLYVGKNFRPIPLPEDNINNLRYAALKKSGIQLVWLDEEGGIFWGQQEEWKWTMLQSIDPTKLEPSGRICAWGDVQRDYYRSVAPEYSQNIQTTGHPRFDLYKPKYREYYDQDVASLCERYGDFVLINTNFHRAYTVQNLKKIFGKRPQLDPTGYDHYESVERWTHLIHLFSAFVKLVARLGHEFPKLNFIIRPHPSENIKFYQTIFNTVPNIHVLHEGPVGPWLLASRALIYNGCTTAIEAHFCGTPAINYKPLEDERFDCMLPNMFGARCTEENEVLDVLNRILTAVGTGNTINISPDATETAASLIENFRRDSFPLLAEAIQREAQSAPRDTTNLLQIVMKSEGRKQTLAQVKSRLRPRKKSSRQPGSSETGMMDKFYGFENVNVERKVQVIRQMLNKPIDYRAVSDELICIEG